MARTPVIPASIGPKELRENEIGGAVAQLPRRARC